MKPMSEEMKKAADDLDCEETILDTGNSQEAADAKKTEDVKDTECTASEEAEESAEDQGKGAGGEDVIEDGAEEAAEDSPGEEGTLSWAERKAAKKKQKADKKLEALKEKNEELEDRVKRQMAEFENFRKRTDKEKSAMFETGARSVIEKILPVVDNFERGLAVIPEEEKSSPFAEGMEMIYKQLITELEKMEVKPIPAVGEEFNPDFHNAVMQVESEEFGSGIIAQELQKGYTYRDGVVRHSLVAVVS